MIEILGGIFNALIECFVIWYNFSIEFQPNKYIKIGDLMTSVVVTAVIMILLFRAFFGGGDKKWVFHFMNL